jgi:hypothetical protein
MFYTAVLEFLYVIMFRPCTLKFLVDKSMYLVLAVEYTF